MNSTLQSFALLAILLIACVQAHDDGHAEERITDKQVEATHKFARSCNKRASSTCVLQSEVTEGPYYYDTELIRRDITEGYAGIPMTLNISVVDVDTCQPVTNAAVDLWHCNSVGVYSHYQNSNNNGGANTTFLRGIQLTDSNGNVSFTTIFPGWYQPRVIHMHVKVHIGGSLTTAGYIGGSVVHTGQMFVTDAIASMLKTVSPYSSNTQTLNTLSNDDIYAQAGSIALMDVQYTNFESAVTAYMTLGVSSTSTSSTTGSNQGGAGSTGSPNQGTSANQGPAATSTTSQSTTAAAADSAASSVHFSFYLALVSFMGVLLA